MIGSNKSVKSRTGSNIDDSFTLDQRPQRERIGDAGERLNGHVRQRVDDRGIVGVACRFVQNCTLSHQWLERIMSIAYRPKRRDRDRPCSSERLQL